MSVTGNRRNPSSQALAPAILSALRVLPTAILSDNMAGLVGTSALIDFPRLRTFNVSCVSA